MDSSAITLEYRSSEGRNGWLTAAMEKVNRKQQSTVRISQEEISILGILINSHSPFAKESVLFLTLFFWPFRV